MALSGLPTLASRPVPDLSKGVSRLAKKVKADQNDERKLRQWRSEIQARDEMHCRCCHVKVVRLSVKTLHPRRAECHHVEDRATLATRYDTRNGLLLCLVCHERVTGKVNDKLHLVGTVQFTKDGHNYINCDYTVKFQKA